MTSSQLVPVAYTSPVFTMEEKAPTTSHSSFFKTPPAMGEHKITFLDSPAHFILVERIIVQHYAISAQGDIIWVNIR